MFSLHFYLDVRLYLFLRFLFYVVVFALCLFLVALSFFGYLVSLFFHLLL